MHLNELLLSESTASWSRAFNILTAEGKKEFRFVLNRDWGVISDFVTSFCYSFCVLVLVVSCSVNVYDVIDDLMGRKINMIQIKRKKEKGHLFLLLITVSMVF